MPLPVKLYNWPDSQVCMGCIHSIGITPTDMEADERIGPSASICMLNYTKEFGKPCSRFKEGNQS